MGAAGLADVGHVGDVLGRDAGLTGPDQDGGLVVAGQALQLFVQVFPHDGGLGYLGGVAPGLVDVAEGFGADRKSVV